MADAQVQDAQVVEEPKVAEPVTETLAENQEQVAPQLPEGQNQEEPIEVEVDAQTAFQVRVQEFDKHIAIAEQKVAELKAQKMSFIYDNNVQMLTEQHKERLIRQQIEEEARKRKEEGNKK